MSKFISSADTNITVIGAATAAGQEYVIEGWVKLA